MQDLNLVPVLPLVKAPSLTPEEETLTRIRLLQSLQVSQDAEGLLANFFKHAQPLLNISGLIYTSPYAHHLTFGRDTIHRCEYNLNVEMQDLGKIVFTQTTRWSESSHITLEHLLTYLVYPLRNVLNYQKALQLSLIDPLTLVGNRASFASNLLRELQIAERHEHDLSLIMLDIDFFKNINDCYGHLRGDQVLKSVAECIQAACRSTDATFRYGGEEFAIILSKTPIAGAKVFADRLCELLQGLHFHHEGKDFTITVSIGVSTHNGGKDSIHGIIDRADIALYNAKNTGRNQVVLQS